MVAVTSALHSLLTADAFSPWLASSLASGRLSFYVSAVVFGALTLPKAFRRLRLEHHAVLWQNLLYGVGLSLLGSCYTFAPDIALLGLLSWAIFFVIDDWALLEHYVVFGDARLPWFHFGPIAGLNVIIGVSGFLVLDEFQGRLLSLGGAEGDELTRDLWINRVCFGVCLLFVLGCGLCALYRLVMRPGPAPTTPAGPSR